MQTRRQKNFLPLSPENGVAPRGFFRWEFKIEMSAMLLAGCHGKSEVRHDSNRTHLAFSTSGLLLNSRAPIVSFWMICYTESASFWWTCWSHGLNNLQVPGFRLLLYLQICSQFHSAIHIDCGLFISWNVLLPLRFVFFQYPHGV